MKIICSRKSYCKSRIFRMQYFFCIFRTRRLPYENKLDAKGTKQVRVSAAISDCTKISCVRKVGEPRRRKLNAYKIFWIYSTCILKLLLLVKTWYFFKRQEDRQNGEYETRKKIEQRTNRKDVLPRDFISCSFYNWWSPWAKHLFYLSSVLLPCLIPFTILSIFLSLKNILKLLQWKRNSKIVS